MKRILSNPFKLRRFNISSIRKNTKGDIKYYSTVETSSRVGRFKELKFLDVEEGIGLFSVLSYNVLYDPFSNANSLPQKLGRTNLILRELDVYNADVICLQEVDHQIYEKLYCNYFEIKGYNHHIYSKNKSTNHGELPSPSDGCVIAYRKSKFTNIEFKDIELRQVLFDKDIHKFGLTKPNFQKLIKRDEIMTVALLETTHKKAQKKKLCVANTHLMSSAGNDTLSTVQAHSCAHVLTKLIDQSGPMSLLFCGSFNIHPRGGTYKYLSEGYLNHNSLWMKMNNLSISDIDFKNNLNLKSAYGQTEFGEPNFTHYKTPEQNGTSDYIWYNPQLRLSRVLKIDEQNIMKYKSLPSLEYPSDHVAIMAEFAFEPSNQMSNHKAT